MDDGHCQTRRAASLSGRRRARALRFADRARRAAAANEGHSADAVHSKVVAALDSISHGLCIYDADDRLIFANAGFCSIYGQPISTLPTGIRFIDMLKGSQKAGNYPGRTADEIWAERKTFIDRREVGTFLQSLGDGRLIAISHQPLADGGWAAIYEDVTERRRFETHLRFMAHHDPLTGLPNRLLFGERLELALSGLIPGKSCSLVCLDLDGFKPVNDSLGHAAGDQLLRLVADRLRRELRDDDVAARLGGDEFAVLLLRGRHAAMRLCDRLARVLSCPYEIEAQSQVTVGVSIGFACAPDHAHGGPELLAAADMALYEDKRRRRTTRAA